MNRLLKAEIYRLKHTGHLTWWAYFVTVCLVVMTYFLCLDRLQMKLPLDEILPSLGTIVILVFNFVPAGVAGISGQLYNKGKLGHYEVMAGNSPSSIIFSKVLADGGFFSFLTIIATTAFYVFVGIRNGIGNVDHPCIRLLLFSIAVIHVVVCSVMIMMYSKKVQVGAFLAYFRFMIFDIGVINVGMIIAEKLGFNTLKYHLAHMLMMNQLQMAALDEISVTLVLHIVIGAIAEFIFWYVLVYWSIKKRKYN